MSNYELSTYKIISSEIKAIRFDGTDEMEDWVDQNCNSSYIDYDEGGRCGLRCPTNADCDNFNYVYEGDYLIYYDGMFIVMNEEEFHTKYYYYA